jgi:hypothetical protein
MDHGAQQAGARPARPMAGMDHGAHQAGAPANAAGGGHAGMQMGRPARTTAIPGDEKLLSLAAELLRDPQVQARVQADTALRRRWQDPDVRRVITTQAP